SGVECPGFRKLHPGYATYIASDLNHRLPEGYFAEPNVQFGIEIDVATFEEFSPGSSDDNAQAKWTPPPPEQTFPFQPAAESVEVSIFNNEEGPTLAGVIELVSPANKDRPASRKIFVSKCEVYLQQGLGLILVDAVTGRKANLHNELLERMVAPAVSHMNTHLYTAAYRAVDRNGRPGLDIWRQPLEVGRSLPIMPLWLHGDLCLPVELDTSYEFTCREQRIITA
ncbi:MAG: DUF4058 domain-containing protein, partial [Gammaproteobacteria bacterium]|nr:DUF4058 domain-containing protein [Gammaproteobacteria bacterium]